MPFGAGAFLFLFWSILCSPPPSRAFSSHIEIMPGNFSLFNCNQIWVNSSSEATCYSAGKVETSLHSGNVNNHAGLPMIWLRQTRLGRRVVPGGGGEGTAVQTSGGRRSPAPRPAPSYPSSPLVTFQYMFKRLFALPPSVACCLKKKVSNQKVKCCEMTKDIMEFKFYNIHFHYQKYDIYFSTNLNIKKEVYEIMPLSKPRWCLMPPCGISG